MDLSSLSGKAKSMDDGCDDSECDNRCCGVTRVIKSKLKDNDDLFRSDTGNDYYVCFDLYLCENKYGE